MLRPRESSRTEGADPRLKGGGPFGYSAGMTFVGTARFVRAVCPIDLTRVPTAGLHDRPA